MPSPLAHILLGFTLPAYRPPQVLGVQSRSGVLVGLTLLASLAPDLDFLPGLLGGDYNRYHQTISHSLGISFLFALALGGIARMLIPGSNGVKLTGILLLVVLSHLFLDYFTEDTRPPIGFPLFWPFTETLYSAPVSIFPPVIRDLNHPGFWSHNGFALLVEILILLPPWVVFHGGFRRRIK